MARTITVTGVGKTFTKPDWISISIRISAEDKKYDKAVELGAKKIIDLQNALVKNGFKKDDLKTHSFRVSTEEDRIKDKYVFRAYSCNHSLSLEFENDMEKLNKALFAIEESKTMPLFDIDFTIRDPVAVKDKVLENATENARQKAELLCKASGEKLGKLLSINYSWGEINVNSETSYYGAHKLMLYESRSLDITPEDIESEDNVTFIWEIE